LAKEEKKESPPFEEKQVKVELSRELRNLFTMSAIHPEGIRQLSEALTHSSYANEMGGEIPNNERLELLGDSVIELIVREYLFRRFPLHAEGKITQIKVNMVNTYALARVAKHIGLNDALLLGRGEKTSGGKRKPSILAQAFEALAGAIYLSCGLEKTTRFVLAAMDEEITRWARQKESLDVKGRLQKHIQKEHSVIPHYVTRDYDEGLFISIVYGGDEVLGSGMGRTKKEAEKRSAYEALKRLGVTKRRDKRRAGNGERKGDAPYDPRYRKPDEQGKPTPDRGEEASPRKDAQTKKRRTKWSRKKK